MLVIVARPLAEPPAGLERGRHGPSLALNPSHPIRCWWLPCRPPAVPQAAALLELFSDMNGFPHQSSDQGPAPSTHRLRRGGERLEAGGSMCRTPPRTDGTIIGILQG